jgi:hypothetical protein
MGILPSVAVQAFWFGRHQAPLPGAWDVARMAASGFAFWAVWGAISGLVFASLLMLRERRHTLGALSTARVALWGALAGLTIPLIIVFYVLTHSPSALLSPIPLLIGGFGAALGCACSLSSLALARRAPLRQAR